jgi:hypothetical protein
MDILTPRGQISRKQEERAIEIWHRHHPRLRYTHTPKDSPASVDAVIVLNDQIVGVVETKCRPQLTIADFRVLYESRWLVTAKKIEDGVDIARGLYVPFVGFLYIPSDDVLLHQTIWKPGQHGYACNVDIRNTRTQATVNGGSIVRENAYVDMSNARALTGRRL